MNTNRFGLIVLLAAMIAPAWAQQPAASATKQKELLAILQSNAPAGEKGVACKLLTVYGTADAVPPLAALLTDKELASWARIALESIPGPAADDALRGGIDKTQGRLLVGVLNSVAYRRDAKAVAPVAAKLRDADPEVVQAAAVALGRIGGYDAATALEQFMAAASPAHRAYAAEGMVLCAERFMTDGKADQAVKLYDAVRKADVPRQRIFEATRGAILARGKDGVPLLVEQLRSQEKGFFQVALRTARELAGEATTAALLAELAKATPDRQSQLLLVLADRKDKSALPAVVELAKTGQGKARVAAVAVIETLGNASCVPVLLEAASTEDAALAAAARTTLARLGGKDIDAEMLSRMTQSQGKAKAVLIEIVEQRRIEGSMAAFLQSIADADAGVRSAAIVAIGANGDEKQAADLAKMLEKTKDAADRAGIEKALMSISTRCGAACVPILLPVTKHNDPPTRIAALNALACAGGADALAAVKAAVDDADATVQDEAVRTLSTWPNRWPNDAAAAPVLLGVAKAPKKPQHAVLALRGYLQYVQSNKALKPEQKLALLNDAQAVITRPEEKRAAISVLAGIGNAGALQSLLKLVDDAQIADEAASAVVVMCGKSVAGANKDVRKAALQTVIGKTKNADIKKRAEEALAGLK